MNDKQQLAAIGASIAQQQIPLCMAKQIEHLQAQLEEATAWRGVMAKLLGRCKPYIDDQKDWGRTYEKNLSREIDAALAGKLPDRPDTEWTDAASTKTAEDYRELQVQHDQLQSKYKAALAEARKYKLAGLGMATSMGDHVCVPEGWQLVPVTPTHDMLCAMIRCDHFDVIHPEMAGKYYRTMLAAAPKQEDAE